MEGREHTKVSLDLLRDKLDSGRMRAARIMVNSLHPAEVARLLESLPLKDRAVLWEIVDPEIEGDEKPAPRPVAAQSLGYMLIGVKPGRVLISFR